MEAIVVIIIMSVLAVMVTPYWRQYLEKQSLRGAAQALLNDLQLLRSEAMQRSKTVTIHWTPGPTWCYGLSDDPALTCDCARAAATCTLGGVPRLTRSSEYIRTQLVSTTFSNNRSGFEPNRGHVLTPGEVLFQSSSGFQVTVSVNAAGRIQACSNNVSPFPPC